MTKVEKIEKITLTRDYILEILATFISSMSSVSTLVEPEDVVLLNGPNGLPACFELMAYATVTVEVST